VDDLVEEVVPLRDGELAVLRPRDAEALIDEDAFEREEQMPYWAELWPSGVALARAVSGAALGGRRVLELGCGGLALPSIAAGLAGARVLATDWAEDALELASMNAERNGTSISTAVVAWESAESLLEVEWDLVLAADVIYERRNVETLLELLPRLGRRTWLADPGRTFTEEFLTRASEVFEVASKRDPVAPAVRVHRMTRR